MRLPVGGAAELLNAIRAGKFRNPPEPCRRGLLRHGRLEVPVEEGEQFLAVFKEKDKVIIKEISPDQFTILNHLSEAKNLNVLFTNLEKIKFLPSEKEWAGVFEILSYCKRAVNIGKVNP